MNQKLVYVLLFLTLTAQAEQTTARNLSSDAGIDPGIIQQWKDLWSPRPIEIQSPNANEVGVAMVFRFRIATALPENSLAEIHFPSTFGFTNNQATVTIPNQQSANTDIEVTLANVSMPNTAGSYGPFGVYTRATANGQIYDMTNALGTVYIGPAITPGSLSIQVQNEPVQVWSLGNTILFTFEQSQDTWPNDTYRIKIDDNWSINQPQCSGYYMTDNNSEVMHADFKSKRQDDNLDCAVSDQYIYIYGISDGFYVSELTQSTYQITLKISGFTAPPYNYPSSSYNWEVTLLKWQSWLKVMEWQGQGTQTQTGLITIDQWTPNGDYPDNEMLQGITLYMDIWVSTSHAIPNNGVIELTFVSVDVKNPYWRFDSNQANGTATVDQNYCYVEYDNSQNLSCSTTETRKILISAPTGLAAQSQVKITALNYFEGSTPSLRVISFVTSSQIINIDSSAEDKTITYVTNNKFLAPTYQFMIATQLDQSTLIGENRTGNADNNYIAIAFEFENNTVVTGQCFIEVSLPSNTAGVADFSIWLKDDSSVTVQGGSLAVNWELGDAPTIQNDWSAITNTRSSASTTNNKIDFTVSDINGNDGIVMFVYNQNNTPGVDPLNLPRVASNLFTRYETWTKLTDPSGKVYQNAKQIGFAPNTFDATSVFDKHCSNVIEFVLVPKFSALLNSDKSYFLTLEFDSTGYDEDLQSGLSVGENYPFYSQNFSGEINIILASSHTLRVENETQYTAATQYTIYTAAQNNDTDLTNDITATLYFINSSTDPRYQMILSQTVFDVDTLSNQGVTVANNDKLSTDQNVVVSTASLSFANQAGTIITANAVRSYYMQFPAGFVITDSSMSVLNSGSSVTTSTNYKLSSTNIDWAFNVLSAQATCPDTDCEASVTSVTAPPYSMASVNIFSGVDADCDLDNNTTVTIGSITVSNQNPTITSRGPVNYHAELQVTFNTDHGIPQSASSSQGGKIQMTLNNQWNICDVTTCNISGLNPLSGSINCSIQVNSQSVTISNFEAIDNSQEITVTFQKILPPENITGSSLVGSVIDSISTSYNSALIDQNLSPGAQYTVNVKEDTGITTFAQVKTIPPNKDLENVDLYVSFRLQNTIPAKSKITLRLPAGVEWNISQVGLQDHVFMNHVYSQVDRTTTDLIFTMEQEVSTNRNVEIYVENAINNPAESLNGFKVRTTYTCSDELVVFDDDINLLQGQSLNLARVLDVNTSEVGQITQVSVEQNNSTAGEQSDYTFKFTLTNLLETDEILIKFPIDYDEQVVGYQPNEEFERYKWADPNQMYTLCYSAQLGTNIECTVDHRMVRVFNPKQITTSTQISLVIYNVLNPSARNTSGQFKIFLTNSSGVAKFKSDSFDGVEITSTVANITFKSTTASNDNAFASANYTYEFFLPSMQLQSETTLNILLPRQYHTNLTKGRDVGITTPCSLSFRNINNAEEQEYQTSTQCPVSDNIFTLNLVDNSTTLGSDHQLTFQVNNIINPEWGLSRNTDDLIWQWNYDITDQDAFSTYDFWVNQSVLFLYDQQNKRLLARSYQNTSSSYLGFNKKQRSFSVGLFNVEDDNDWIKVYPGTQTADLAIKTQGGQNKPFSGDHVVFTPTINNYIINDTGTITLTSTQDKFTMYDWESYTKFRISASIDTDQGIYYINWGVNETQLSTVPTAQYNPPVKTKIEVAPFTNISLTVNPQASISIYKGFSSVPIRVQTTQTANKELEFTLQLTNANLRQFVAITPSKLSFKPNVNYQYFTITVNNEYDLTTNPNNLQISFTKDGIDAEAFADIGELSFSILDNTSIEQNNATFSIEVVNEGRNTAQLVGSAGDGIIYWQCVPEGTPFESIDNIKDLITPDFNYSQPLEESKRPREAAVKPNDSDNDSYTDTWEAFQHRLFKEFLIKSRWIGAKISFTSVSNSIATFQSLYAEVDYNCEAVFEDNLGRQSETYTESFKTTLLPEAARISLRFDGNVKDDLQLEIQQLVSYASGLQVASLVNATYQQTRNPDDSIIASIFSWDLGARRYAVTPEPVDSLTLDSDQEALLKSLLKSKTDNNVTITTTAISKSSYGTPTWTQNQLPSYSNVSTNQLALNASCTVVGQICSVCQHNNGSGSFPNHNQVQVGLNVNNVDTPSKCVRYTEPDTTATWDISGLNQNTEYICYFQCFNDYPIWGNYITYTKTSENPIASVTFKTLEVDEEQTSESAEILYVISLLLLLV